MKRKLICTLAVIFMLLSAAPSFAAEADVSQYSLVLAVNETVAIHNGEEVNIPAPVIVFDNVYVDIYKVSPLLGLKVKWINEGYGYPSVSGVGFKGISSWDDLKLSSKKCFTKNSSMYVSLNELIKLSGYECKNENGVITVGSKTTADLKAVFGTVDTSDCNEYIYSKYGIPASHVVYPYSEYSYENMLHDAKKLEKMYPELISTSSIGYSVENRELLLVEFGKGPNKIFVCGTHHAREYISTTYLMYAIDRYAYAYRNNSAWGSYNPRAILDEVTFCIVPMVNPDGVNLVQNGIYATTNAEALSHMKIYEGAQYGHSAWKANVRGVDVNWNYNKDWSKDRNKNDRGSTGFNGDYPNTEPETAAVSAYVDAHSFDAYLSFHTQGQIFYWADSKSNPMNIHRKLARDTGFTGYEDEATGVGGSFFDYVYRKFDKPTITVELCPYVGNYPYPNENFDIVWAPAKNILLLVGNEIIYKTPFGIKNKNSNSYGQGGDLFDRVKRTIGY